MCLENIADRVNLGLIPNSEPGWPTACKALKSSGGIMHIHGNVNSRSCKQPKRKKNDLETNISDSLSEQQEEIKSCWETVNDMPAICDHRQSDDISFLTEYEPDVSTFLSRDEVWQSWAVYVSQTIKLLLEKYKSKTWTTNIIHVHHVKSYAPFVDHLVLDLQCQPFNKAQ